MGRDVLRKLQRDKRVIETIKMARQHGFPSDGLEFGAACALLSRVVETKPSNAESAGVKALYTVNHPAADVLANDWEYNNLLYKDLTGKQITNRSHAFRQNLMGQKQSAWLTL